MKQEYALVTRRRYRVIKTIVGLAVVCSIFLLLFFIWIGQDKLTPFTKTVTFQSRLTNAENIKQGMPVKIAGIIVGEVSRLKLESDGSILMTIKIKEQFHPMITKNTFLRLHNPMFGSSTLNLVTGGQPSPRLPEASFLPFPAKADTDDLIASLPAQIARVEKILINTERITMHLAERQGPLLSAVENLNAITQSLKGFIDRETGTTGRVSKSMDLFNQSLGQLEPLISEMNNTIHSLKKPLSRSEAIMDNFQKGSANSVAITLQLQELLTKVNANILILEKILGNVQQTAERFNEVSPKVGRVVDRTRDVTEQADEILDAAKQSPLLKGAFPDVVIKPVDSNPRIEWPLKEMKQNNEKKQGQ